LGEEGRITSETRQDRQKKAKGKPGRSAGEKKADGPRRRNSVDHDKSSGLATCGKSPVLYAEMLAKETLPTKEGSRRSEEESELAERQGSLKPVLDKEAQHAGTAGEGTRAVHVGRTGEERKQELIFYARLYGDLSKKRSNVAGGQRGVHVFQESENRSSTNARGNL